MYLFFVRAFNDIDHITPVVWKMRQDNHSVAVYCTNPEYDIQSDYHLSFLRTNGVTVDFLYNKFDPNMGGLYRFIRSVMFRSYRMHKLLTRENRSMPSAILNVLGKLARTIGKFAYHLLKAFFCRKDWACRIIEETNAQALCFDHIRPRQYVVKIFLEAAKEKSIPVLALPHGVYIYTNELVKAGATEERAYDKYNLFDYIITQNQLRKDVLAKAGVQKEKIIVLGSARYCDEWMTQHKRIVPIEMASVVPGNKKLRAVFMTTRPQFRIDVDRMMKTFDILSRLEGVDVVIKPHTRTGKEAHIYDNLSLSNLSDVSSVELSEWADVMLVIASSIIIEALFRGKPALYLKYLHANTTQYEELGACWIINHEEELIRALRSLQEGKRELPYTKENVNRFLSEIIYGGQYERDVLLDYEQFIVNCAKGDS
jgi:hypothetical protein